MESTSGSLRSIHQSQGGHRAGPPFCSSVGARFGCYLTAEGHHFQQLKTDPTLPSWPSHWPPRRLDYHVQLRQQHLQQHYASYFLSHLHCCSARGSPHWASGQIQQSCVSNHDCPWLLCGHRPTLKHGWLCSSAVYGYTCANCLNKLVKWYWSAWSAQMAFWVSPPGCCQLPTPGVWRSREVTAASPLKLQLNHASCNPSLKSRRPACAWSNPPAHMVTALSVMCFLWWPLWTPIVMSA